MNVFTARYHGSCEECCGPILPGQEVAYNVRDDLVHVECPPQFTALDVRPGESVCATCYLIHAGECA